MTLLHVASLLEVWRRHDKEVVLEDGGASKQKQRASSSGSEACWVEVYRKARGALYMSLKFRTGDVFWVCIRSQSPSRGANQVAG